MEKEEEQTEKVPEEKESPDEVKAESASKDNSESPESVQWKKRDGVSLAFILVLFFTAGVLYSLPSAFYSPFVVNEKKGDLTQVGLVLASFDLSNIIVSIFYPYLMLGMNSKTLFHCGALVMWIMNIAFGCVMQITMDRSLFIVFSVIIRITIGSGVALLCCSGCQLIACCSPKRLAVGFITWAISATWLGDMLGPLIGGLIEAATDTFVVPFVVISVLIIICQVVVACTVRKQISQDKLVTMLISLNTWYSFLFRFEIIMVCMATFIIALGMGAIETDFALYLKDEFKMGEATIALIFGLMPVMFAIVAPISSFLNKHPYPLTMLACSIFFLCPGFGFLASGTNIYEDNIDAQTAVMIICVCLIGIGVALGQSPFYPFVLQIALEEGFQDDAELRLKIAAVNNTTYAIGRLIGTVILGGIITHYVNFEATNLIICFSYFALYIFFIVAYICFKKRLEKLRKKELDEGNNEKLPLKSDLEKTRSESEKRDSKTNEDYKSQLDVDPKKAPEGELTAKTPESAGKASDSRESPNMKASEVTKTNNEPVS